MLEWASVWALVFFLESYACQSIVLIYPPRCLQLLKLDQSRVQKASAPTRHVIDRVASAPLLTVVSVAVVTVVPVVPVVVCGVVEDVPVVDVIVVAVVVAVVVLLSVVVCSEVVEVSVVVAVVTVVVGGGMVISTQRPTMLPPTAE